MKLTILVFLYYGELVKNSRYIPLDTDSIKCSASFTLCIIRSDSVKCSASIPWLTCYWINLPLIQEKFFEAPEVGIIGIFALVKYKNEQECIPVGCVPAARWPYAAVCFPGGGGVCCQGVCSGGKGGSAPGGVCSGGGGVCLVWGVWSRGVCVSGLGGVSAPGGCLLPGGVCVSGPGGCVCVWSGGVFLPGGCVSGLEGLPAGGEFSLPETPPVDRITDACKNITLAQLRCGR